MTQPKLDDYQTFYDQFDVAWLDGHFSGSFADGINACIECVDRHTGEGRIALYWEGMDGTSGDGVQGATADVETDHAPFLLDPKYL